MKSAPKKACNGRVEGNKEGIGLPSTCFSFAQVQNDNGVVEMKEPVDMRRLTAEFARRGAWLRPFGRLVYTMPPFVASEDELRTITSAMCGGLKAVEG